MQNERIVLRSHIEVPENLVSSMSLNALNILDFMKKNQSRSLEKKPHNCHQIVIKILLISLHPLQTNARKQCVHIGAHHSEKEAG